MCCMKKKQEREVAEKMCGGIRFANVLHDNLHQKGVSPSVHVYKPDTVTVTVIVTVTKQARTL
jgi:hypothetical protein